MQKVLVILVIALVLALLYFIPARKEKPIIIICIVLAGVLSFVGPYLVDPVDGESHSTNEQITESNDSDNMFQGHSDGVADKEQDAVSQKNDYLHSEEVKQSEENLSYKENRALERINAEYQAVMEKCDIYWEDVWEYNKVYRYLNNILYIKTCKDLNGLQNDVYFYYDENMRCYLIVIPEKGIRIYVLNQELLSYVDNDTEIDESDKLTLYNDLIDESRSLVTNYYIERISSNLPPDDAVIYNGHYYKKYITEMRWREAQIYCEKVGGHLVFIEDLEEQAVLEDMLDEDSDAYWIGGFCNMEKTWYDGTLIMFDNAAEEWEDGLVGYLQIIGGKKQKNWRWVSNDAAQCGFICEWE